MGDGFLATFDGPARGIRCARAIADDVRALDINVRAGLHTGECELVGDDIGGMAVNIGARIGALAGADEVLVSSTVKDLVVGSGISFADRGTHDRTARAPSSPRNSAAIARATRSPCSSAITPAFGSGYAVRERDQVDVADRVARLGGVRVCVGVDADPAVLGEGRSPRRRPAADAAAPKGGGRTAPRRRPG